MGIEGGTSMVRKIFIALVTIILVLWLARMATGKTEALGCGWWDSLSQIVSSIPVLGKGTPTTAC